MLSYPRLSRAQGALVGGIILLILLAAVVLPIFFQYFNSLSTVTMASQIALEVRSRGLNEKLDVMIPPEEDPWVSKGLYPSIIINNTGLVEVKIERIYILNATSGLPFYDPLLCGDLKPCGIIDMANATANPLVAGATPTAYDCLVGILRGDELVECLDDKPGRIPVLKPGETLFIKLVGDIVPYLPNIYVYVETSRGMIHPIAYAARLGGAGPKGLVGSKIPILPRGLYMPVTGFILWGYDEIKNYTRVEVIRPPYRISTLGPRDESIGLDTDNIVYLCGGIPYRLLGRDLDPDHPGLSIIMFTVNDICEYYDCSLYVNKEGTWDTIRLEPGKWYIIRGFVGLTYVDKPSPDLFDDNGFYKEVCPSELEGVPLLVLDGWAYNISVYDPETGRETPLLTASKPSISINPVIMRTDIDNNGIDELFVTTYDLSTSNNHIVDTVDADKSNDMYAVDEGDVNDDTLMFKITVLRDITGVDAIGVYVKALFARWLVQHEPVGDLWKISPQPILAIGLLRLDKKTLKWRLVAYKTVHLARMVTPWVSELFPVNRSDVYRVVIFVYDSYPWIPNDGKGVVGWCIDAYKELEWEIVNGMLIYNYYCQELRSTSFDTLDMGMGVEHIIVNYYVYNPLLKKVPVVYIVNITGVAEWPSGKWGNIQFGELNSTFYNWFWLYVIDTLERNGIHPVVINDWDEFKALLGSSEAPVNPIVIFAHGPILPYPPTGFKLYDPVLDQYREIDSVSDFVEWLAHMVLKRGWVVVFPYGPSMAFAQSVGSSPKYYGSDLLSWFMQHLTNGKVENVDFVYQLVAEKSPERVSELCNYTAGLTSEGLEARRALRAWRMPRVVYANYSLVSSDPDFYSVFHPYYFNTTPPDFEQWSDLGVVGNYASPAGYVLAGKGAAVFIAVSRPGVLDPVKLAEIVLALSLYTWKLVVGA